MSAAHGTHADVRSSGLERGQNTVAGTHADVRSSGVVLAANVHDAASSGRVKKTDTSTWNENSMVGRLAKILRKHGLQGDDTQS